MRDSRIRRRAFEGEWFASMPNRERGPSSLGSRSLLQATHLAADGQPETSHPLKLSGTSGDGFYNTIYTTTSCQTFLADEKTAFEALVRDHLRIDGFAIFSKAEEISFIDSIRASGSDQALRELFDIFAAKYRLLEAALFQGVRANANLV